MSFGVEKNISFTKSEWSDLISFCKMNELDPDQTIKDSYLKGFRIEKYGLLGNTPEVYEKLVEKEVIVEKREEIPVEVIKTVEKIIEVPIEKEIIKEVPVSPYCLNSQGLLRRFPVGENWTRGFGIGRGWP